MSKSDIPPRDGVSRRRFLATAGLGVGVAALGAGAFSLRRCGKDDPVANPEALDIYGVWREFSEVLRMSPDHTVGKAERLVKEGDAAAIQRFVRDEIRLMSGDGTRHSFGGVSLVGARATLRAGAGTAGDKAKLLAHLLRKTGLETEIVFTSLPTREETPGMFFRDHDPEFDPSFTEEQYRLWRQVLGEPAMVKRPAKGVDDGYKTSDALGERLLAAIGDEKDRIGRGSYDPRPVYSLPMVKITGADGAEVFADPIRPDGGYGPLPEGIRLERTPDRKDGLEVEVVLEATSSHDPKNVFPLVAGKWAGEEIAGRQVRVSFHIPGGLATMASSRFADVRTFVPFLSVQGFDATEEEPLPAPVMGDAVTAAGDVILVEDNGAVKVNGVTVSEKEGGGEDVSQVAKVELEADASRFPEVELKIFPRDAKGRLVEGLAASVFTVEEGGSGALPFVLRSNRSVPRVLLLTDSSLSMPEEYRGGRPGITALVEHLKKSVLGVHPEADLVLRNTGSNLWEELTKAALEPHTLIVYATDGDLVGRRPDERMFATLKSGPPAIVLDVRGTLEATRVSQPGNIFDEMAKATGGLAFPVIAGEVEASREAIAKLLEEWIRDQPTRLRYTAPTLDAGTHVVKLTTGAIGSEATYEPPAQGALPQQLASLRLSVRVNSRKVTRVLAGHDGRGEVKPEHLHAVRGALFGTHLLAFEGAAPGLSVLLDDFLSVKLAQEDLDRMVVDGVEMDVLDARLAQGLPVMPGELLSLLARSHPGSSAEHSVSVLGLRTVLYSCHPVMESDRVIRRVDILPLEDAHVHAVERETMLKHSFRYSLPLSLAEGVLFARSTFSVTEGRELVKIDRRPFGNLDLTPEVKARWADLIERLRNEEASGGSVYIAPADGRDLVVWRISRTTGAVLGVLEDGSGGGSDEERIMR